MSARLQFFIAVFIVVAGISLTITKVSFALLIGFVAAIILAFLDYVLKNFLDILESFFD
jgi:type IV secretory pathway VirB2 component (pilin)